MTSNIFCNFQPSQLLCVLRLSILIIWWKADEWFGMMTVTRDILKLCFKMSVCFKHFVTRGTFGREKLHVRHATP